MDAPAIKVVAPPTALPVSVNAVMDYLSIQDRGRRNEVQSILEAAVDFIDGPGNYGVGIREQTWRMDMEGIRLAAEGRVSLPGNPFREVAGVTYTTDAGRDAILGQDNYRVAQAGQDAVLVLADTFTAPRDGVEPPRYAVEYRVGWDADDVPATVRQAILFLCSQMITHKTGTMPGTRQNLFGRGQSAVDRLMGPHRRSTRVYV